MSREVAREASRRKVRPCILRVYAKWGLESGTLATGEVSSLTAKAAENGCLEQDERAPFLHQERFGSIPEAA